MRPRRATGLPEAPEIRLATADSILRRAEPDALLDRSELQRAAGLSNPQRYRAYVAGRCFLRQLLSQSVQQAIAPAAWRFREGPHGKPGVVPGLPPIFFNLSHADDVIAVALHNMSEIGVDLEACDQPDAAFAELALSDTERADLAARPAAGRQQDIIRLWSAKEACAKALGLGVLLDFRQIEVDLQRAQARLLGDRGSPSRAVNLRFERPVFRGRAYCLSLAVLERHAPAGRPRGAALYGKPRTHAS